MNLHRVLSVETIFVFQKIHMPPKDVLSDI